MSYAVKEIYFTVQGEGVNTGRPAVFLRFAGCNLWSGREEDRERAVCSFCDTDFVGIDGPDGGRFETAKELADAVLSLWPSAQEDLVEFAGLMSRARRSAMISTSGLEVGAGSEIRVSRSPTAPGPKQGSQTPSAVQTGAERQRFVVCTGGEPLLQLDAELVEALHQRDFDVAVETNGTMQPPAGIDWLCVSPKAGAQLLLDSGDELKLVYPQPGASPHEFEELDFRHFSLQPMHGPDIDRNIAAAFAFCRDHPRWRVSLQAHKLVGIP